MISVWQQHDVQELCRVMFDALEVTWRNTDQEKLINQLYQGKMKDYVKCLEVRYDTFHVRQCSAKKFYRRGQISHVNKKVWDSAVKHGSINENIKGHV